MFGFLKPGGKKSGLPDPAKRGLMDEAVHAARLVTLACQVRAPIDLAVAGRRERFRSMFLALDDSGSVIIDNVFSQRQRDKTLAPAGTPLQLRFELNDIPHRCDSALLGMEMFEGFPAIRIALPARVEVDQKREHYRVAPLETEPVHIIVKAGQGREAPPVDKARVVDISAGGARMRMSRPVKPGLVAPVAIELPMTENTINTDLEVIDTQTIEHKPAKKTGVERFQMRGRFLEMREGAIQTIYRYVAARQREINKLRF